MIFASIVSYTGSNNETLYILTGLFISAWLFQFIHYLYVLQAFNKFKQPEPSTVMPPVSVVICAKNEAPNLKKFLPMVLEQDYPEFQVVVVNDTSTDDTEMVLAEMKRRYKNLYYTSIPADNKFFHGKKLALSLGIKAAKYDHLVLTDADCYPATGEWLQHMAGSFSDVKKIVLGYGGYEKHKGFVNLMVRFETFWNAVQYFGFALTIRPFMGVGRNMAYEKELFTNSSQFRNNLTVASGDDDLFIIEAGNKKNTTICAVPDSHTMSIPPKTLKELKLQKSRHLTSSVHYPLLIKSWLFFENFTRQIFWLLTICSIIFSIFAPIAGVMFAVLISTKLIVLSKAAKKLQQKQLFWALLLFDWLIPIWIGILWISNLLRPKKIKWK
jgi:cellulose synthase/poly-beta-1,6-N-acetylglucosamine synthase-like glycosyltransferase